MGCIHPRPALHEVTEWQPMTGRWEDAATGSLILEAHEGIGALSEGILCEVRCADVAGKGKMIQVREEIFGQLTTFILRDGLLLEPDGRLDWTGGFVESQLDPVIWGRTRRDHSRVADLIRSGKVRVIRGSYFDDRLKRDLRIQKRQEIEEEYFWDPQEAVDLWLSYGRLFLHIVSYSWLSADHSDPDSFHLKRIAAIVNKSMRHIGSIFKVKDIAVAIDYCSLFQKERDADEEIAFFHGLKGFNDMYIDEDVTALKLTAMPVGVKKSYDLRGWTYAESRLIDAKPGNWNRFAFDDGFDPEKESAQGWNFKRKFIPQISLPPLNPEDMKNGLKALRTKVEAQRLSLFAPGKDSTLIPQIYSDTFQLTKCLSLNFGARKWGAEQLKMLCKVLPSCNALRYLSLDENPDLGAQGIAAFCQILPALENLRLLSMCKCGIDEDNGITISFTVKRMSSLRWLALRDNKLDAHGEAMKLLRKACGDRVALLLRD